MAVIGATQRVDCAACPVGPEELSRREGEVSRCQDCVVMVLELLPPVPAAADFLWSDEGLDCDLDAGEWAAVGDFVRAGLIARPRARLLRAVREDEMSVATSWSEGHHAHLA